MIVTLQAPNPLEAQALADSIATKPQNYIRVQSITNNTVEVFVNHDLDSAIDLLTGIISALPWYVGQGVPLSDSVKQAVNILRNRDEQIDAAVNGDYTNSQNYVPPPPRRDPLVLDLNGNGLETVGINPLNPILFDHDGDGIKQSTGWIAPSDGLLVMDKNGNGTIDNGRELFGDATLKSNGQLATDGFDALADLDSNHDGVVNALDANFTNLKVWQDTNQDGISQAGELFTLTQKGITSFNVANVAHSQVLPNGNQIADLGSYTKSDGSLSTLGNVTGSLADVNLASNPFYSQFTDTIPLSAAVQTLPDMQGAGMVRDLREAANDEVVLVRWIS